VNRTLVADQTDQRVDFLSERQMQFIY